MPTQDDAGEAAASRGGSWRPRLVLLICLALVGGLAAAIGLAVIRTAERDVAGDSTVEVVYCAGWDPRTREAAGVMSADQARARDKAGDPYAVLLVDGARPGALLQVDWGHHYLGVFLFEKHGRRDRAYDYSELEPGLLHLRSYEQWRYESPDAPEFPEGGWHFTLTARPDADGASVKLDQGSLFETYHDVPERYRSLRRAPFGDWTAYVRGRMLGLDKGAGDVAVTRSPDGGHQDAVPPLWRAPAAMRPSYLRAMFIPGSRFSDSERNAAVVTQPEAAGVLRVPTGAVIAADPGTLDSRDEPFTVKVPAGNYPVLVAGMRWERERWGESTAAMLRILDKPTASWELAVRPGEDARMLGDGEFYGFGVDSGMGAFLDASGRDALAATYQRRQESDPSDDEVTETADPASGTNMIAYLSGRGDGSYPVWIGRDADGAVTCLVADMLVLNGMKPLPPAKPDTAVFLTPAPAPSGARPEPKPASPEATAEFLATVADDIEAMRKRVSRR